MSRTSGARTSAAIQDAAAELFLRGGYATTSLREIAAAVGIQVGSLYNHIDGKRQLPRDMMLGVMDELLAAMADAVSTSTGPATRLEARPGPPHPLPRHSRARRLHRELRASLSRTRGSSGGQCEAAGYGEMTRGLVDDLGSSGRADVIDARLQVFWIVATGTHVASWNRPGAGLSLDEVVAVCTEAIMRHLEVDRAGSFAGRDAHTTAVRAGTGGGR
ncbi:TetR family transcriptional regulator [Streptomyces sp. NPDC044780]|uniref:TetR family transcriptional regulator n=1 Tax=unclassified Streptomyces TaxID=2593676 RepID=UPI0033D23890